MGQKIVVTAKMKALEDTSLPEPLVVYHWHWRRLGWAGIVVGTITFAAIWGVFSMVNAKEVTKDSVLKTPSHVSIPNEDTENDVLIGSDKVSDAAIKPAKPLSEAASDEPHKMVQKDIATPDNVQPVGAEALPEAQKPTMPSTTLSQVSRGVEIDTNFVTRAVLTVAVEDREPVDVLGSEVYTNQFNDQLYFFTEISDITPQLVSHVWFFNGVQIIEIMLDITSTHFRTYSSKTIDEQQMGDWQVQLRDSNQQILAQKTFRIINRNSNL